LVNEDFQLDARAGVGLNQHADGCAPRRREGSGSGPELERHAA